MPATRPNVFNIPASAPFLPVLIDNLRAGKLVQGFPASNDPLELARLTLYVVITQGEQVVEQSDNTPSQVGAFSDD